MSREKKYQDVIDLLTELNKRLMELNERAARLEGKTSSIVAIMQFLVGVMIGLYLLIALIALG
ncbi:MAG: hypothetical protein ACTSR0_03925 [Candidatus Asgardarchaeia archaeon]